MEQPKPNLSWAKCKLGQSCSVNGPLVSLASTFPWSCSYPAEGRDSWRCRPTCQLRPPQRNVQTAADFCTGQTCQSSPGSRQSYPTHNRWRGLTKVPVLPSNHSNLSFQAPKLTIITRYHFRDNFMQVSKTTAAWYWSLKGINKVIRFLPNPDS